MAACSVNASRNASLRTTMNPLCCVAPVSADQDHSGIISSVKSSNQTKLSQSLSFKVIDHNSKPSFSSFSDTEDAIEGASSRWSPAAGPTAGILHKWVNYGKGWQPRWFMLEDGVLSYYKISASDIAFTSNGGEKGFRLIGEEHSKHKKRSSPISNGSNPGTPPKRNPMGKIHLKVSSIRASKSDDRKLTIFTGVKTVHLRCLSKEDRTVWLDSLKAAKDVFPRISSSKELFHTEEIVVSTDKLRARLMQDGIAEVIIKDCESIMLSDLSELQQRLEDLQNKHVLLLDTLRQLEADKIELETTVVDETKKKDSVSLSRRFSGISTTDCMNYGSPDGLDVESDDEETLFFDSCESLASDFLRSSSCRSRDSGSLLDPDASYSNGSGEILSANNVARYPLLKRRDSLPEPKAREKAIGLWSIIKENIGKDLSGVCLPVYFNEPLSLLQKCFEDFEYSYLVDRALDFGKQGDALMRILNVAAFAVSSYASSLGRQCKPFNPLLGETYEADYPDRGLRFFSEKVSHHPMVVACHCEGRGWNFWADCNLKGKFWGRAIQLDPVGVLTLQFEDGEIFQWNKVTSSIYNIILGKLYCDHYGTMHIKGSGKFSCKLKFKEQSIIDRNPHQVHGFVQDNMTGEKVAILVGKWDEAMYYVIGDPSSKPRGYDPMTEAVLIWEKDKSATKTRYNLSPFAISLNEITPQLLEKLPPTDSRFRPDQRHLENGEYELANEEKLRLELLQRQARKVQERGWQPKWFRKDENGCYRYTGGYWEARGTKNWDGIPKIFGQSADSCLAED